MLNWQNLRNDLPKQIADLCNLGLEFSSSLDRATKEKQASEETYRGLLSSFERLRQSLKTAVFTKATDLEKIKVPLVQFPVEESEEKKMISLPVKDYINKFEEDLKEYYQNIREEKMLEGIKALTFSSKVMFFFTLKSFEAYVYDIIRISKEEFYRILKPLKYERRQEIKQKIIQMINWKLKNLNNIAENILRINLTEKELTRIISAFILTLKPITKTKELTKITANMIKESYPFIDMLIQKIKDRTLIIGTDESYTLMSRIRIANNPPFNNFFNNLTEKEIDHAFTFPTPDDEKIFWDIFLASIIQRAGLIPKLKEKAREMGGTIEVER